MNTLYLVRHGENLANITKELSYKKVDYPLTERGVLQARQTAEYLRDKGIDAIYSSPLKRAHQTAQIIAERAGAPVIVDERFREINVGDMEGSATDDDWRRYFEIVGAWDNGDHHVTFPGGENYTTLLRRAEEGLRDAVEGRDGASIAVVAHGGIFVSTMKDICPQPGINGLLNTEFPNCGVSEVKMGVEDGRLRGRIVEWAVCNHLSGEAAAMTQALPAFAYEEAGRDED